MAYYVNPDTSKGRTWEETKKMKIVTVEEKEARIKANIKKALDSGMSLLDLGHGKEFEDLLK